MDEQYDQIADLKQQIADLDKEIAVLRTKLCAGDEARKLQASEYERRLTELNHAHKQQLDRNAEYISREAWELYRAELEKWRREVDAWRWISIGAGASGGGLVAYLLQTVLK